MRPLCPRGSRCWRDLGVRPLRCANCRDPDARKATWPRRAAIDRLNRGTATLCRLPNPATPVAAEDECRKRSAGRCVIIPRHLLQGDIMPGKLMLVGFGPGQHDHLTFRGRAAIEEAEVIIGYTTYIKLVKPLCEGKQVIYTGMTEELSRARKAIDLAYEGRRVALISSGDVGVYGMAGPSFEILKERGWRRGEGIEVEVIPGVTAASSCASVLGAPLMHDFCTISLSDLLTPWNLIVERIDAAAKADFVVALYNPKSGRRTKQIVEAQQILLRYRSAKTPVGLVKSCY